MISVLSKILVAILVTLIKIYQALISPLLGQRCRFYPSCSQYAIEVLREWGVIKGSWLAAKRLLKCNPWNDGGVDLPPKKAVKSYE